MYPARLVEFINSANSGSPFRVRDVQSVGHYRAYALTQSDHAATLPLEALENYANERRGRYGGFANEDGHRIDLVRVYGENFVVVIKTADGPFNPKADAMAVLGFDETIPT